MLPEGFILRMQSLLGEEYAAFSASFDRPLCTGLRLNPLKTGFTGDLSRFSLSPVPWCPTGYVYDAASRPGLSSYHAAGLYYLQEPSAMAPAELLDPQPGERVLDIYTRKHTSDFMAEMGRSMERWLANWRGDRL